MSNDKCRVLVGTDPFETRVVVLRGDTLDQFYIERKERSNLLGSIYGARVAKVLPGIRAAFIDIGMERSAFLPSTQVMSEEFVDATAPGGQPKPEGGERKHRRKRRRGVEVIERSIRKGEELMVQVIQVPGAEKGPKVTTYLSIPGHYLVYMPTVKGLGVSKKILSRKERTRLRGIGEAIKKEMEGGYIIRSVSDGVPEEKLMQEARWLHGRWAQAVARAKGKKPPHLILPEVTLGERVLREMKGEEIDEILVDDLETLEILKQYARSAGVDFEGRVRLWNKEEDMFASMGVEERIERSFSRKIMLGSGGHIVIDQAEALTAIDVNTGSFTGDRDPGQTVLTTNLEAVREIAYQLRLRHIGGLIILDLIDMDSEEHKELVYRELVKQIKGDKAKISVRRISDMGLIEMTREHYGPRIMAMLQEKCWYCDGTGHILSRDAICGKILRAIIRALRAEPGDLAVTAHQSLVLRMESEFAGYLRTIEGTHQAKVRFVPKIDVHIEYFNITRASS